MHYISSLLYEFDSKVITEFISIYFENYAYEYLFNKYNIPIEEMQYDKRLLSIFKNALMARTIAFPLLIYSNFGNLDDNSYRYGKQILNQYTKEMYDYEIETAYESIDRFDNNFSYNSSLSASHYYVFSTLLAFYARKKCEMKDIINLANNAKDENIDLIELLKKYNINITYNMICDVFESIDDYLDTFEKDKKQRN